MEWPAEPTQPRFPAPSLRVVGSCTLPGVAGTSFRPLGLPGSSRARTRAEGVTVRSSGLCCLQAFLPHLAPPPRVPSLPPPPVICEYTLVCPISLSAFMTLHVSIPIPISLYKFLCLPLPSLVHSQVSFPLSSPTPFPRLLSPCLPFPSVPKILTRGLEERAWWMSFTPGGDCI